MTKTVNLLLNASKVDSVVLGDNEHYVAPEIYPTKLKALNLILSADIDGGIPSGITVYAGPSKSFKTMLGLISMKAVLDKYDDAVVVFYDTEFGSLPNYWDSIGIDKSRVIHTPVPSIEDLTHDMSEKLEVIKKEGLKVAFLLDSLGHLSSSEEIEASKTPAGMKRDVGMRAQKIKAFFRLINIPVNVAKIPFVVINHVYDQIGQMYAEKVMSGGQGPMLTANNVIFISSSKMKKGSEEVGREFLLVAKKGRMVKENSKVRIQVPFNGGINPNAGLFDTMVDLEIIEKLSGGWYKFGDEKFQRSKFDNDIEFANSILESPGVKERISEAYKYTSHLDAS